jgi:hypothetical protein
MFNKTVRFTYKRPKFKECVADIIDPIWVGAHLYIGCSKHASVSEKRRAKRK